MQTSANAKIRNKSDPGFVFGLICIRMSVVSVPKFWMHYLVSVSHFAKYGRNRLLIVWELRKQRNANKRPKIAYSSVVKKTRLVELCCRKGPRDRFNSKIPRAQFLTNSQPTQFQYLIRNVRRGYVDPQRIGGSTKASLRRGPSKTWKITIAAYSRWSRGRREEAQPTLSVPHG